MLCSVSLVKGFVGGSAGVLWRVLPKSLCKLLEDKGLSVYTEPGGVIQQNKCVKSLGNQASLGRQDSHPGRWLFSVHVAR